MLSLYNKVIQPILLIRLKIILISITYMKTMVLTILFSCVLLVSNVQADIIVITNPNFKADTISINTLKKLWLGKTKKISSIGRVYIVDQIKNNDSTRLFYHKIIKKNPKQVKAYWAKIQFIGKGFPPKSLLNDNAVIKWVLKTKNGIGYIDSKMKTDTIKVLMTISGPQP